MSEPTTKEILQRLEYLMEICRLYGEQNHPNSHCPECPCGQCEHELDAIRAAVEERGRLRETVKKWQKRIREFHALGKLGKLDWLNLVDFCFYEISDFKFDGEEAAQPAKGD